MPVDARGQDAVLFKLRGNLLRSDPFQRHAVNPPHDLRRFLVHDPAFGVLRVFDVPVRRLPHGFTGIALDLVADAPLLADVSRIPFVKKITDGSQLVLTFVGVDVVRNSDQPNVVIGKELLGQSADLDVITTQAAEIFYKHGCCFSLLQLLNHIGKAGAIHRNAGDAVVHKRLTDQLQILMSCHIVLADGSLAGDGVAFNFVSILTGQTAVDRRAVNLIWYKNNLRFSVWCGTSNQKDEGLLQLL